MSEYIKSAELYKKLAIEYNKGRVPWGTNEIFKDLIAECKTYSFPEREKETQTVWEQWCEELKACGKDLVNKKYLICNCGLYDMECTNKGNGKKCPLFYTRFCGCNYIEADKYLESEVTPNDDNNPQS